MRHCLVASMGPGCFHPRNNATYTETTLRVTLQWGRDVSIPEIPPANASPIPAGRLQWGRDVSIPEINWHIPDGRVLAGFNGAGMFPSQKLGAGSVMVFAPNASMGPGCLHPRNKKLGDLRAPLAIASMGPGCFHPRNATDQQKLVAINASLNGAGMFPSQKCAPPDWGMLRSAALQWGRDVSIPEIGATLGTTSGDQ